MDKKPLIIVNKENILISGKLKDVISEIDKILKSCRKGEKLKDTLDRIIK